MTVTCGIKRNHVEDNEEIDEKSERKKLREKNRRSEVNGKFKELSELMDYAENIISRRRNEPTEIEKTSSQKSDLICRAIRVMTSLLEENVELKNTIATGNNSDVSYHHYDRSSNENPSISRQMRSNHNIDSSITGEMTIQLQSIHTQLNHVLQLQYQSCQMHLQQQSAQLLSSQSSSSQSSYTGSSPYVFPSLSSLPVTIPALTSSSPTAFAHISISPSSAQVAPVTYHPLETSTSLNSTPITDHSTVPCTQPNDAHVSDNSSVCSSSHSHPPRVPSHLSPTQTPLSLSHPADYSVDVTTATAAQAHSLSFSQSLVEIATRYANTKLLEPSTDQDISDGQPIYHTSPCHSLHDNNTNNDDNQQYSHVNNCHNNINTTHHIHSLYGSSSPPHNSHMEENHMDHHDIHNTSCCTEDYKNLDDFLDDEAFHTVFSPLLSLDDCEGELPPPTHAECA